MAKDKKKVQVVIGYKNQEGEKYFLLLKTNASRKNFWQNVTGSVENKESYKEAAIRESCEETGICLKNIHSISDLQLKYRFTKSNKTYREKTFFIFAKNFWEVKIDPKEHDEFKWISADSINSESVFYSSNFDALEKAKWLIC